jgi:surface polysaccharide O-acyltransferase-like enzyme
MGQVMLALGLLSTAPAWRVPGLAALGRRSLGVYVAHLVVLYGWAGDPGLAAPWTHRLSVPAALGLSTVVFAAAVAMARGVPAALAWLEENMTSRWQERSARAG